MPDFKPLSQTPLWQDMLKRYEQKGVKVWQDELPTFVTTNKAFCYKTAELVSLFLKEGLENHTFDANEPIYIIELGGGSGRFCFEMLNRLSELLPPFGMSTLHWTYVFSDGCVSNLNALKQHPQLQFFIEQGKLDFSLFNIEMSDALLLMQKNKSLNDMNLRNPPIILGNYILDTLKADAFYIDEHHTFFEQLVDYKLTTPFFSNETEYLKPFCSIEYHKNKSCLPYYPKNPDYDKVLEDLKNNVMDKSFLLPITAFKLIDFIQQSIHKQAIYIFADKNSATLEYLQDMHHIKPAFHAGVCSFVVNFYAIGQFCKAKEGHYWHKDNPISSQFSNAVFSVGINLDAFVLSKHTFKKEPLVNHVHSLTWFFNVFNTLPLDEILLMLDIERWEPALFEEVVNRLAALYPRADNSEKSHILKNLEKIEKEYLEISLKPDLNLSLGLFYTRIGEHTKAITRLEKSASLFKLNSQSLALMQECAKHLGVKLTLADSIAIKPGLLKSKLFKWVTHFESQHETIPLQELFTICWRSVLSAGLLLYVLYGFNF